MNIKRDESQYSTEDREKDMMALAKVTALMEAM